MTIIQMDDPESLLAWIRQSPRRVAEQLVGIRVLRPQYAGAIDQALAVARERARAAAAGRRGGDPAGGGHAQG